MVDTLRLTALPDERGRFGSFGGSFVPETLMHALDELTSVYQSVRQDPDFHSEYNLTLSDNLGERNQIYLQKFLLM